MAREAKERLKKTNEYFKQRVYDEDKRKREFEERNRKMKETFNDMRSTFAKNLN